MKLKNGLRSLQVALIGMAASGAAMAQTGGIDTSDVLTQVTAAATAVLAVGAAIVAGPKIAVKVYKWIGRAL